MKFFATLFLLLFAVSAQAATCVVYNINRNPPRVEVDTLSVYPACDPLGGAVMTSAEIVNIDTQIQTLTAAVAGLPANQTFDPVLAAAFWSFAMTFVLGCWLLAKNAGVILSFIRRA